MLKSKIYFVAAIGTDIGKTFFVTKICQSLRDKKKMVLAIKPVASGFFIDDLASDSAKILQSLDIEITPQNIAAITPWRFEAAVSPHLAARFEGRQINFDEVVDFCKSKIATAKNNDEFLFIEAAGGVMTPLCEDKTFLDLAKELQVPILLVSASYLGSISHTLCAIASIRGSGLEIEKVVINDYDKICDSSLSADDMIEAVEKFGRVRAQKMAQVIV